MLFKWKSVWLFHIDIYISMYEVYNLWCRRNGTCHNWFNVYEKAGVQYSDLQGLPERVSQFLQGCHFFFNQLYSPRSLIFLHVTCHMTCLNVTIVLWIQSHSTFKYTPEQDSQIWKLAMKCTQTRHHSVVFLNRSLMIGWRKNSWNPERVSSVFTFVSVCLSACMYAGYRAHLLA